MKKFSDALNEFNTVYVKALPITFFTWKFGSFEVFSPGIFQHLNWWTNKDKVTQVCGNLNKILWTNWGTIRVHQSFPNKSQNSGKILGIKIKKFQSIYRKIYRPEFLLLFFNCKWLFVNIRRIFIFQHKISTKNWEL